MSAHIILDLSALVGMEQHHTPRGIPRVELAYAKHLMRTAPDRLSFTAFWGRLGPVPAEAAKALVEALDTCWAGLDCSAAAGERARGIVRRLRRDILLYGDRALYSRLPGPGVEVVCLIVSHPLLGRMRTLHRIKERLGASFVCFIHDLIGIEFPALVRPRQARRHPRRMESVARFADIVIANSTATATAFQRRYETAGFRSPLVVAPLGVDLRGSSQPTADGDPYFVCVAAIEPRKNHRLLFKLWHRLSAELGVRAPRLVLVGHRGWKSKSILRGVSRSTIRLRLIEEHDSLADARVARLLLGARALLYPSFAEGYGLPVAEALALRVPVICSELAELREVGQAVPEYLDPHDERAWAEVIRDYAKPGSARRREQLLRMATWRAPSWRQHFAIVQPVLDRLGADGTEAKTVPIARRLGDSRPP